MLPGLLLSPALPTRRSPPEVNPERLIVPKELERECPRGVVSPADDVAEAGALLLGDGSPELIPESRLPLTVAETMQCG